MTKEILTGVVLGLFILTVVSRVDIIELQQEVRENRNNIQLIKEK